MFQDINENTIKQEEFDYIQNKFKIISKVFEKNNIAIYIVALMIGMAGLDGTFSIFSISLLGACFAANIPAIGVVIMSLIGSAIGYGQEGIMAYFLTSLILIVSMLIFKPRYNEKEKNEKIKIGKNIFIATFIVQAIGFVFGPFTIYQVLSSITVSMIALVFYKIFVNSIRVLQNIRERKALTIEEVIGASIILSIAVTSFGELSIFGFSVRNVLSILIVMVLGWKNGILVGTTAGVTIGVILGVITGTEPIVIAAYSISGMIAGLLNKFGKLGVALGFVLGNILLAYVSNGYTVELIYFKEILIATVGLLMIPKSFSIELTDILGDTKFLPVVPERALNRNKETVENLNNVSKIIQEMAGVYKKVESASFEENTQTNANKHIFMAELLNNLEPYRDCIIYEDIADIDGEILKDIFLQLLDKQEIDKKILIEIFKKNNSYIIGLEEDNSINSKELNEIVEQIIRNINFSYKVSKAEFIWKKKLEEKEKVMESQLNKVSEAIKEIAEEIEVDHVEDMYINERKEIEELLRQKNILCNDINILKEEKHIIEIYLKESVDNKKISQIEKILTTVFKENIVLNKIASSDNKNIFISEDKFDMSIGIAQVAKNESEISGDSILDIKLKDGKRLIVISDGMGTGRKAKKSSSNTLKLLEDMLITGFNKNTSLELINSLLLNNGDELFATLDIAIVDLYTGKIEMIKSAASPTYIKSKKKVTMIKSASLPTGIIEDAKAQVFDRDINSGDIVTMCSDGIIDANIEYKNKELWIKYLLEDIETVSTNKIANLILNEAIDNNFGMPKDDMSVITFKFKKKENI